MYRFPIAAVAAAVVLSAAAPSLAKPAPVFEVEGVKSGSDVSDLVPRFGACEFEGVEGGWNELIKPARERLPGQSYTCKVPLSKWLGVEVQGVTITVAVNRDGAHLLNGFSALYWPKDHAALKAKLVELYGRPFETGVDPQVGEVSVWKFGSRYLRLEEKNRYIKGAQVYYFEPRDLEDDW